MRCRNVIVTVQRHLFLKHIGYIFLYLNIYTVFFQEITAQELTLTIKAEKPISTELMDSLNTATSFNDYLSLKQAADSLPVRLQRMGYLESALQSLQKKNDNNYVAQYFFGKKYTEIKIFYDPGHFSKKELLTIASEVTPEYFILPAISIETSLQRLSSIKAESGNAFAKIRLKRISKNEDGTLSAALELEQGTKRTIDSLVVKGYEKFPRSFLKYYAGVKKGRPFSQKKLIAQNDALNSLGFVSTIKAPEALFKENATVVYFYLEKRNNNLFDGILGFATNEETQNLEFNGYLNLELNNNLHYGEQLLLNYKADGNEQQNFRVRVKLPYLFKTPFGAGFELNIFKRDSSFVTTEQIAQLTYQINPPSSVYAGYKGYESSNLLDEELAGIAIEDYTSRFFISGISYVTLQNSRLFPSKTTINIATEAGSRTQKKIKEGQLRLITEASNIFNLNYRNSIFINNDTGILFSETYLTNELFRFGGINSIRGFDENSIDASLFSILNTEYRYQFNEGLYLHSIIDVGYFENETLSIKQKLYSFGLGLGLQTKAGIFKFNIANGNSEGQNFNFSNTKIHLSLSSRF